MLDCFYARGLRFSCRRCSACCRFDPGFVFLSENDLVLLTNTLKMEPRGFLEAYCRWVPSDNGKERLSLKEKSNYDCIFWSADRGGGCSVYEARPLQCRTFPFWRPLVDSEDGWEETAKTCPGMNEGTLHSRESIEKHLALREAEAVITRDALLSTSPS